MVRTALLAGALAAIVASSWARLEQPRPGLGELLVVASLAVAPALVRGRLRIVAVAIATLVAGSVALDVPLRWALPFDDRDIVASLASRTWEGFLSFYDVTVPFEGIGQPFMHGAVLMAVFVFSLAGALAVAARKPPLALAASAPRRGVARDDAARRQRARARPADPRSRAWCCSPRCGRDR